MARINRVDSSHDIGRSCKIDLISYTYTSDSIGELQPVETVRNIFANVRSVYGTEFARSGEQGIKAAKIFTIWENEYEDEEELLFGSERFSIYRTYVRADGRIELYTEKKVGKNG